MNKPQLDPGRKLFAANQSLRALKFFIKTMGRLEDPELLYWIGRCWLQLGDVEKADDAFTRTYDELDDTEMTLPAQILREQAMISLRRRNYEKSWNQLTESAELLGQNPIEHAVTISYMGRHAAAMRDPEEAHRFYTLAHVILCREDRGSSHVLDNLTWWLEVEPELSQRFKRSSQAWNLAGAALNRKRQLRIMLLLACRPFAGRIFD